MRSSTKRTDRQPGAFELPRYDEIALVLQGGGALAPIRLASMRV